LHFMSDDDATENKSPECRNNCPDWVKRFMDHLQSFSSHEEWKGVCELWFQQEMRLGWDENQGGKSV